MERKESNYNPEDHEHEPIKRFPWIAIAASLLLLAAPLALFLIYNAGGTTSAKMVRTAIAEAEPQFVRSRGSVINTSPALQASFAYFEKGNYSLAEKDLLLYEDRNPKDSIPSHVLEYHGLLLLRLERPAEAEPFLQKLVQDAPQYPDRYWLYSLSLYQQEKWNACLDALENFIEDNKDSMDDVRKDKVETAQELRKAIQEKLAE